MRKGLVNKPLAYIIDLDGTLYDNNHRQHLIPEDKHDTAAWVEFNSACAGDTLREDMADLVRSILLSGREAIFLTGRGEAAREPTMKRILNDFNFIETPTLIMRPMDSMVPPESYKRTAVELLRASSRWGNYKFIAIEDDPAIVDVFRNIGLTVLHVDSQCCAVQPSNELADLKRHYAELQAVVDQRNGECDRLINEQQNLVMLVKVLCRSLKKYNHGSDLVKRATDYLTAGGFISAADCLRGQSFVNAEQLDTAPAQFEALAGKYPAFTKDWVMVPKNPTAAMCDISHVGVDILTGVTTDPEYYSLGREYAAKVWRAMLASVEPKHVICNKGEGYLVKEFGVLKVTMEDQHMNIHIDDFSFVCNEVTQHKEGTIILKYALQAVIDRLQAECNKYDSVEVKP